MHRIFTAMLVHAVLYYNFDLICCPDVPKAEVTKTMGFFLFDGFLPLDLFGPWDIFNFWSYFFAPQVKTISFAETSDWITSANGVVLQPMYSLANLPNLTYLVIGGGHGEGFDKVLANKPLLNKLAGLANQADAVLTVCAGALILHATGAANNVDLTTYWRAANLLRCRGGNVVGKRVVQDGKFWSSGGVTAGIDLALAFIDYVSGREVAGKTQLLVEYFPSQENYACKSDVDKLPPYEEDKNCKPRKSLPEYLEKILEKPVNLCT